MFSFFFCTSLRIIIRHIYRQADEEFAKLLNDVRVGNITPRVVLSLLGCSRQLSTTDNILPTKLFATNDDVRFFIIILYFICLVIKILIFAIE